MGCFLTSDKGIQNFIQCFWTAITSCERAIIFLTLWNHLNKKWGLAAAQDYYSISIIMFSLMILLSTLMFSFMSYKLCRINRLFIVACLFQIAGSLIYGVATSPWQILLSRMLSGIGYGCNTILYGDLTKLTERRERFQCSIVVDVTNYIGLISAPIVLLILLSMGTDIEAATYNIFGIMHTILYGLCFILVCCLYPPTTRSVLDFKHVFSVKLKVDLTSTLKIYTTLPMITLLYCAFSSSFCAFAAETSFILYMNSNFPLSVLGINYMFIGFTLMAILVLLLLYISVGAFSEWKVVVIGLSIISIAYIWMICIMNPDAAINQNDLIYLICTGGLLHMIGQPMYKNAIFSLYTKLTEVELQNYTDQRNTDEIQKAIGLFRTCVNVGFLFGPLTVALLWGIPQAIFGLMLFFTFPVLILFIFWNNAFHPKTLAECFKS